MEANSDAGYFSILPPRLEDAGVEDPALPVEGILEAFRRAAEVVNPINFNLLQRTNDGCTNNPGPSNGEWEDSVLDASVGQQKDAGSCIETQTGGMIEEGHDSIVGPEDCPSSTEEDRPIEDDLIGPKLGEAGCIPEPIEPDLPGPKKADNESQGNDDIPGLTEAYF